MTPNLLSGLHSLINMLFSLYLFVLLIRILLPAVRADYYNPFSQFIIKLTQPLLAPLQKILPHTQRFDTAAVLLLWVLTCLKIWILFGLLLSTKISVWGGALFAIAQILEMLVQFYFFAIIIQSILSWIQPRTHTSFGIILHQLTEPLLAPARRHIPPIAGLDISPLVVLIVLQLLNIVIVKPCVIFTLQLTIGILR